MTFSATFTFTISDEVGEKWTEGAQESAQEFCDELRSFIDRHPFVESCTAFPIQPNPGIGEA